jgi:hypothetical protein
VTTFHASALGTLVLVAVSAPATAQLQAARQLAPLHVPIHTAADDEGAAYGIWGAAESYKASFHDGMTFVPYLGAEYPHNQPWSWRTTAATVGGVPLLEPGAEPESVQGQYRYEYRFGGITEAYDVRVDGLEQTFVVSQLPARGDLVITGEVTSALRAPARDAAQQALTFVDENGTPIVGYGEAWAFDADGARTPVTTAHVDGRITLTVPGEWLAHAALPVVVDPLLYLAQVFGYLQTIQTVDIGHDEEALAANVMVVAVYSASQFDNDVYARVCNDDYSSQHNVYADSSTTWDSREARCAFVGGANRWVLVFRRYFVQNPIRVSLLRCHVHDSGSTTLGTSVSGMATPVGFNEWRPDIGGVRSYMAGSHALVVYQREDNTNTAGHWDNVAESRVYAVLFDATTPAGTFGAPFPVLATAGYDFERPSVNQVARGGSSFSWVCAMQAYANSVALDDWDVLVRRIENDGTMSGNVWQSDLAPQNTHHQMAPAVDGIDGRYAVTFATTTVASQPTKSTNVRGTSVWVQRFDWPHGSLPYPADQPPVEVLSDVDRIYETGCIAIDTWDSSHFAVGCRTLSAAPDAIGMRVGFRGQLTEGPFPLLSQPGATFTQVACTFDHGNRNFLFAYGRRLGTNQLAIGHTLGYAPVAPSQQSGFGCNATQLFWIGTQQIGAEFEDLTAVSSPNALHIMLASTATLDVPVPLAGVEPGCRMLVDVFGPGYIGILDARVGSFVGWDIPLFENFTPTTLYFQDWILENGVLSSSKRLEVEIVK